MLQWADMSNSRSAEISAARVADDVDVRIATDTGGKHRPIFHLQRSVCPELESERLAKIVVVSARMTSVLQPENRTP